MAVRMGFTPGAKKKQESAQCKQMFQSDDPFQIDKWYDACKEHTFETKLIPLTLEQAKAINFMCHYFRLFKAHQIETKEKKGFGITLNHNTQLLHKSLNEYIKNEDNKNNTNSQLSYHWGESFDWKALRDESSQQYIKPLLELEENINKAIQELDCDQGVFIRLNTRSPKDSAIEAIQTYQLLFQELKEWDKINRIKYENKEKDNVYFNLNNNQIFLSFYRAIIKSLCVQNGFAAIGLLCRSYERVFKDLILSTLKQGEEKLKLYCTVRKWYNVVDPVWEFRLVVKNYKATALTQYHKTFMIPYAKKHKVFFEKRILAKFEIIKDKLSKKLKDFTIDFAVVLKDKSIQNKPMEVDNKEEDDEKEDPIQKVYLIEINHEPPTAGTALFDFKDEEDKKILDGKKPFEFRIYEEPLEFRRIENVLPENAVNFVTVLRGEYQEEKEENQEKGEEVPEQIGFFDACVLL